MARLPTLLTNLRGPAGYNATGAAEDDAAIAAFVKSLVGDTETRKALLASFVKKGMPEGLSGQGRYDTPTGIYGVDRVPRAAMKVLSDAMTAHKKILCVGHSLVGGSGAGGATNSWPSKLRNTLGNTIPQNTGVVFATQASSPTDQQWTIGAGWNRFSTDNATLFLNSSTAGSLATFVSGRAGTIVDIWTTGQSAAFEYRIDSGAWTTFTPNATIFGPQRAQVTGLPSAVHTVAIRSLTAANTHLVGVEVRNATGLSITNMGAGGSLSTQWVTSTWFQLGAMSNMIAPDLTFIQISANDMRLPVSISTYSANLQNMVTRYKQYGDVVLIVDPQANTQDAGGYAGIPAARSQEYRQAAFSVADTNSLRVFDAQGFFGDFTQANAEGAMFDSVHMTDFGYSRFARAIDRIMEP